MDDKSGSALNVTEQEMYSFRLFGVFYSLKNLFPSKRHFFVFVAYMIFFINQGILVTATKDENNRYPYNTTTVVLLSEVFKLIVAVILQLRESTFEEFIEQVRGNTKVLLLYVVPAFMYCLYNNLAFVNLANYDPTSYYLLLQFRVVITGVIFQVLFNKKLSMLQWVSLMLLTFGCVLKQVQYEKVSTIGNAFSLQFDVHLFLILLQVLCSCFAGVYNEYLLKGKSGDVPFMIQNVFMYLDSVVCNIAVLGTNGTLREAFTKDSLSSIVQVRVLAIVFNNAAIGITTALFLKKFNSILKTFASALEIMFTAILCWIIFGIPVDIFTSIAIAIVSYAVVLYSRNPVDNTPKASKTEGLHSGKSNI